MSDKDWLDLFLNSTGVCTDTRTIQPGNLFFALKGVNFNGNLFAQKAIESGAIACVVDENISCESKKVISVDNALRALQHLAYLYRKSLANVTLIGVGGSNGKTTSKELIAAILGTSYRTYATKGNLNNHIGVPLSLLSIPKDTQVAVIEMGANHVGELELLCTIAEPNVGLITNAGKDHLEGYGSIENVALSNSELYKWLASHKGLAIVNEADELMKKQASNLERILYFGQDTEVFILDQNPYVQLSFYGKTIHTQLFGTYNALNVEAAIKIGLYFGVPLDKCIEAIESYTPNNNRSQFKKTATNTLILDCYNANPSSMEVALKSLSQMSAKHKVAILGDMFELGVFSSVEHEQILAKSLTLSIDQVWVCGSHFYDAALTFPQVKRFISRESLAMELLKNQLTHSTILLKGSRSMQMEKLVEYL